MKKKMLKKKELNIVLDLLIELYPDAEVELDHNNPFELLVATILSAQCTDVRVNKVTKVLFDKVKTPREFLDLSITELGEIIHSCGFYNMKSKNILGTCLILEEKFNGQVPDNLEDLITLPGVGRKTANVVISNAYGVPAIAVDTHVFRVSNRIGLADSKNVEDTEIDLMNNIKEELWIRAHHMLIFHGRRVCKARNPMCEICPISPYCFYYNKRG